MKNDQNEVEKRKIVTCKQNFLKNNFNFYVVESPEEAKNMVMDKIIPKLNIKTASWGDSMTVMETGILKELENSESIKFIQTFDKKIPRNLIIERRRKALTVDLFITGSNALTEKGQLVNLDGSGNRVAPMIFGPKYVIIIAGRNKIVSDISEAMDRIRNHAAPLNARRHNYKTPCVFTDKCMDCQHENRICSYWGIIEKSKPPGRISIILINEDLGL